MNKKKVAILSLGNGLDLNIGISSAFSSFFNTKLKPKGIFDTSLLFSNVWYLLCSFRFGMFKTDEGIVKVLDDNNPLWMDVEGLIRDVILKTNALGKNVLLDRINFLLASNSPKLDIPERITEDAINDQDRFLRIAVGNKKGYKNAYDLLFSDLKSFENDFADYLKAEKKNFATYDLEFNSRMRLFSEAMSNRGLHILNFNYTEPSKDFDGTFAHVHPHGTLETSKIIIGIDNDSIPRNLTQPGFILQERRFTKAWRKIETEKDEPSLPSRKLVGALAFYGLSLGPQDYSYYHSLFSFYSIYDSDVDLYFFYTRYGKTNEENEEIRLAYIDKVFALLSGYASRVLGQSQSQTFISKLQLEGRLKICPIFEGFSSAER